MTTRVLPRHEWPRLKGTELETLWPLLPQDADVLVVEEDGDIVGCWALYLLPHVEGVWVHPAHRGRGGVVRRLLSGMRTLVYALQRDTAVQTGALDTEDGAVVAEMLKKLGAVELPGRHFAWRM